MRNYGLIQSIPNIKDYISLYNSPWNERIDDYIKRRTTSPLSPTDTALNQLIKGCELVIHSAVLLTKENE